LWQSETAYSVNAIANNPNNYAYSHIIYAEMAEAYYAGQKDRTAISYAQKSIGKAKNYLKPYRILAESFMKNGEPDKALQVASDGLKLFPDSKVLMSIRSEASAKKSKAQPGSTPAPAVK
jgi:tetratricopeptide (TPR) repeat protein